MGLEVLISLITYQVIEQKVIDSISQNWLIHYFGITSRIPLIISYLIIFSMFFRSGFDWGKGIEKANNISLNIIFSLVFMIIGLELFDRLLFDLSKVIDYFSGVKLEPLRFSENSDVAMFYRGISVLIISPVLEELFFRKFLFGELLKRNSLLASIIFSSICFSLIHLPSYRNLLPTFVLGVFSCFVYKNTNNIFYPIILHFLSNLSWLLLMIYGKAYYYWIYELEYNLIYWLLPILGSGFLYIGMKKMTAANNGYMPCR